VNVAVEETLRAAKFDQAETRRDALPNASFIGFTGTPIEHTDANTRAVFGDYISIYDIQRAVLAKSTPGERKSDDEVIERPRAITRHRETHSAQVR